MSARCGEGVRWTGACAAAEAYNCALLARAGHTAGAQVCGSAHARKPSHLPPAVRRVPGARPGGSSGKGRQPDQTSGVGAGGPACRAAVSPACVRAAPRSILEGCMCPSDRRAEGRARRFHPILMTLRFHRPCLWPQKICTDCGRERVHLSMCKRSAVQTAGCHLDAHVLLPCSATPRCCSEGPRRPRSCSARRSWRNASRRSTRPS